MAAAAGAPPRPHTLLHAVGTEWILWSFHNVNEAFSRGNEQKLHWNSPTNGWRPARPYTPLTKALSHYEIIRGVPCRVQYLGTYSCTRLGDLAKPLRGCDLASGTTAVHRADLAQTRQPHNGDAHVTPQPAQKLQPNLRTLQRNHLPLVCCGQNAKNELFGRVYWTPAGQIAVKSYGQQY